MKRNSSIYYKSIASLVACIMLLFVIMLSIPQQTVISSSLATPQGGSVLMAEVDNDKLHAIDDIIYSGSVYKPVVTVGNYTELVDYDVQYFRGSDITKDFISVGMITVVVTMKNGHSGVLNTSYSILPREHTFDPAPSVKSVIYNGKEQLPVVNMTEGFREGYHYQLFYYRDGVVTTDFTSSGIITIVIDMINNFSGQYELSYGIKPSMISGTVPAGEYSVINTRGFSHETKATLTLVETPMINFKQYTSDSDEILIYYKLEMSEGEGNYIQYESFYLRLPKPSRIARASDAKIIYNERSIIRNKSCEIEGNYMVFEISGDGEFAIVLTEQVKENSGWWVMPLVICVGIVLLAIIIATIFFAFRRAGSRYIPR